MTLARRGAAAVGAALILASCAITQPPNAARPSVPTPSGPSAPPTMPGPTASSLPVPASPSTMSSRPTRPPPATSTTMPRPSPTTPPTTPTTRPTSCAIPQSLRGRDLTTVSGARVVALTFDGGAGSGKAGRILDTLAASRVPASFFYTGRFAEAHPAVARRIAARYPVGNHTQSHPDLTTLSDAAVRAEIRRGAATIERVAGVDPRPYFRFPFGAVDRRRIRLVNDECYVPFRWTVNTLGWKGTSGGMSRAKVVSRVLQGASPGGIVLMHLGEHPRDGSTLDADSLPAIIAGLRERGYRFVTVQETLPQAP